MNQANTIETGPPQQGPGPSFKDIARALVGQADTRAELCQLAYKGVGLA